jgi:O-antigen ligase
VVAGSLLTGALGLHLPAAIMGRGRVQILASIGAGVTLLGVFATGSRGPWLASGALVVIALVVGVATIRPSSRRVRVMVVGGVIALAACGSAWLLVGDSIGRRVSLARQEISGAIEEKQFTSDTGARLLMWWWALEAMGEHPVIGVGAGGYRAWVESHLVEQGIDPAERSTHDHAHSTPLHIGATSGVIGLAIGALLLATAMRGALEGLDRAFLGSYDAGPAFAIVGLMLAGLFDPVHINAQTAALLITLFALCQYPRPAPANAKGVE